MVSEIVNKVKAFVEDESKKPEAHYGHQCYICHFVPMVEHAKNLARWNPEADSEVVEIAAWLHDIGSIMKGRKDHHITGSEIAEQKLLEWGYDKQKTARVKECVFCHRGSQNIVKSSVEAQIIADADSLSAFDNISGLFRAAIFDEGMTQIEARKSVREKLNNCWNKLSVEAKKYVQHKYLAAMILLEDQKND